MFYSPHNTNANCIIVKKRITISLDPELVQRIDSERQTSKGSVARSKFLEEKLKGCLTDTDHHSTALPRRWSWTGGSLGSCATSGRSFAARKRSTSSRSKGVSMALLARSLIVTALEDMGVRDRSKLVVPFIMPYNVAG